MDDGVGRESLVDNLAEEVELRHKRGLEDNRDVASVEELNRVCSSSASLVLVLDGKVNTESLCSFSKSLPTVTYLEENDNSENHNSSQEIGYVWQVLSVERLSQGSNLIGTGNQQVNQSDQSTLVLGTAGSLDSGWREGLPDNGFTNVGGDEKGDTRSKTVTYIIRFTIHAFKPFCKSSSHTMTRIPAKRSWTMSKNALPAPRSAHSPYIPEKTYTEA